MLEIIDLSYKVKNKVLFDNVYLKIEDNDLIFLLGSNGCGKSTLLNIIGNVIINKKIKITNTFNDIFYLTDKFTLIDNYTSLDNLIIFNNYFKSKLNPYKISETLQIENKTITKLSKGNRQKVGLAIALMSSANLILIDEALDGLDNDSIKEFIKLLKSINKAALVVTHNNRVLRYKNVRRIKIIEGKLIEC